MSPFKSAPARLALGISLCAVSAFAAEPSWPDLSSPMPAQGGGENDAAVIVGVEKYLAVPGIPGAVQNASDWYAYLSRTRLVPPTNIHLLRDTLATREKMKKALTEAASEVKPGGTLWFVFIGHGAPARDAKDGVLVGFDAQQDADSLYDRSLSRSEVLALASGGASHRSLVLLDACFSGRSAAGELVKGLQPLIPLASRVNELGTTVLLTAGSSDQFAGPLPGGTRPAFSYLVLGGLRGWADRNSDGKITVDELHQYTRDSLQTVLTDRTQTPELSGTPFKEAVGRGTETGPDLTAWVIAHRPKAPGGSELSFGGTVEIRVPRVTVSSAAGLRELNIQAEQLLEKAQDAEDAKSTSPDQKADAWCRLAEIPLNNPYATQAKDGCKSWRAYGAAVRRRDASLAEDYQTLAGYLRLKRKAKEQKVSTATAFLSAYSSLTSDPNVSAVVQARSALMGGQESELPDHEPVLRNQCDSGSPLACVILGNFASRGVWPLGKDDAQAVALYGRACSETSTLGCTALGFLHERGLGVPKSYPTAARYYQKACDAADGSGCAALAGMLFAGNGFEKDGAKGAAFLDRACDAGEFGACLNLGRRYHQGLDVRPDGRQALVLYEKACNGGEADGCELAAAAYRDGAFGPVDANRAIALFEKTCASGRASACAGEAQIYDRNDDEKSALLYKKACELGDGNSCGRVRAVAERREARATAAAQAAAAAEAARLRLVAQQREDVAKGARTRGFVVGGLGAGCLAIAGLLGLAGNGINDKVATGGYSTAAKIKDAVDTGQSLNAAAYVFLAAGLVGAGVGTAMVINASGDQVSVTASPAPFGAKVSIGGTF